MKKTVIVSYTDPVLRPDISKSCCFPVRMALLLTQDRARLTLSWGYNWPFVVPYP